MYRIPSGMSVGQWIRQLYAKYGTARNFYRSREWRKLRDEVLHDAHWQCADCLRKSPAKVTRADTVHHEHHVRTHPDEALTRYVDIDGKRVQILIPLCYDCHERRHGRAHGQSSHRPKGFNNEERW